MNPMTFGNMTQPSAECCCYIMQAKGKIQLVRREIDFSLENLSVSLNHRFILCQEDNQDGYFMIQLSSFQLTVRKTIREDCHGRFYRNFAGSSCICRPYSRVSNNRGYGTNVYLGLPVFDIKIIV